MVKIIIDAENAVFGRLCSFAAKKALEGNEVIIVNSGKTIITGNKNDIIEKYQRLKKIGGHSLKGPRYSSYSYKIVKKCIRGMLPDFRGGQGKMAFKRIKCYDNIPNELESEDKIQMGIQKVKYIRLEEVLRLI